MNRVLLGIYWLIILLISSVSYAFDKTDEQFWFNTTAQGHFYRGEQATRYKYWLEGLERLGEHVTRSSQQMLRPAVGYELNETTSIWLGAAWVETGSPFADKNFLERRSWQQLLWVKNYAHLSLTSRLRLEQRFLTNDSQVLWRIREFVKLVSPILSHPKWRVVGSNELFWQHHIANRNTYGLNQNRFFMGLGYKWNNQISYELGYLNQYTFKHPSPNLLANILAFNILLTFR